MIFNSLAVFAASFSPFCQEFGSDGDFSNTYFLDPRMAIPFPIFLYALPLSRVDQAISKGHSGSEFGVTQNTGILMSV